MSHPESARILPNVRLGQDVVIGEFTIVGHPPAGTDRETCQPLSATEPPSDPTPSSTRATRLAADFATGHGVCIREQNTIGDNVSIGTHSVIEHHVEIGNGVRIHSCAFVPEYTVIEDGAWLGPNVVLTNTLHPVCPHAKECMRGPRIRAGAKICASACILPDIEIGEMALVGAGAVVTQDVPPRAVAVGIPLRISKTIDDLRCRYGICDKPYPGEEDQP